MEQRLRAIISYLRMLQPLHWILLIGLAHALVYVFGVPPWQHYDEPGQFAYAWMIAHHETFPAAGETDAAIDVPIAASMQAHRFGAYTQSPFPIFQAGAPPNIGGSQADWQSAYYLLLSLPLRLVPNASVEVQLYVARLASMLLFLGTLAASYACLCEWTANGNRVRWLVPLAMALLPGFVDTMTSVNNDVGAVFGFSMLLWIALRMVRNGFTLLRGILAFCMTVFCIWVKTNTFFALPLFWMAISISIFRGTYRRFAYAGILIAGIVMTGLIIGWGDALSWTRKMPQVQTTRQEIETSPWGRAAIRLVLDGDHVSVRIAQPIPEAWNASLIDTPITVGAWAWCSTPPGSAFVTFSNGFEKYSFGIPCTNKPTFFTYVVPPVQLVRNFWVELSANREELQNTTVYFDGIVLVQGVWTTSPAPIFDDGYADAGTWDGKRFKNLVRNPSAEFAGPRTNAWLDRVKIQNYYPASIFQTAVDWPAAWSYYVATANVIFHTFWAKFSWGRVALIGGEWPYRLLGLISVLGIMGVLLYLIRKPRALFCAEGFLAGSALIFLWAQDFLRATASLVDYLALPVARYTYPVILPVMLLLVIGWRELTRSIRLPAGGKPIVFVAGFIALDIFALISQWAYYTSR
jgi:hypothetical protein